MQQWQELIRRITRRQVVVHKLTRWKPPTGFSLECQLPGDGTTVAELAAAASRLAAAANLPAGCGVEVLPSDRGRRWALIRVATVNVMAESKAIPEELSQLSINQPLPIGVHPDGSLATVQLRYTSGVLVGQVGSGKSNTLNVVTHQLARCPDTLIWAIDLSGGGRMPRPWVRAWHEGRARWPTIDWVGNSEEEAMRLCDAAIAIINGRTPAYQQLMVEAK